MASLMISKSRGLAIISVFALGLVSIGPAMAQGWSTEAKSGTFGTGGQRGAAIRLPLAALLLREHRAGRVTPKPLARAKAIISGLRLSPAGVQVVHRRLGAKNSANTVG